MGNVQWFRNDSDGHIGAVKINEEGRREGVSVGPGVTVELTDEEMRLTARAPKDPADNPLVHGGPGGGPALVPVEETDDRPVRPPEPGEAPAEPEAGHEGEETAAGQPQGDAPEGSRPAAEEVGVPPAAA